MTDFSIATTKDGNVADIVIAGELDMYTAPQLRDTLVELTATGVRQVTVDLAGVNFVDSTALGVLVGGLKRLRQADGDLALRSPRPSALKVMEMTGLTRVFTVTQADGGAPRPPD